MPVQKFFTKGINDATLLVPVTGGGPPTEYDILGVQSLDFSFSTDQLEVMGDDALLMVWVHSLKGDLKFKTAALDMDILSRIVGDTVTTTSTGVNQVDSIYLGTDKIYSASECMLRFTVVAKDSNNVERRSKVFFFAAQINGPPKPDGLDTKSAGTYEWAFSLLQNDKDEKNATITPLPAMARLEVGPTS